MTKDATRLVPMTFEVTDGWGQIIDRYLGTEEIDRTDVVRDGPSMIVRDMRDFFWPEGAKDIQSAAWVIDRSWETWETLKAFAGLSAVAVLGMCLGAVSALFAFRRLRT